MEQKDYILREIEKIGAMLRMLIRRRFEQKDTREEETKSELPFDELLSETGIDLEEILQLEKSDFQSFFNINKGFNLENIELLADLMAQLSESNNFQKTDLYKTQAIEIYRYINETSHTFSMERDLKINYLMKK